MAQQVLSCAWNRVVPQLGEFSRFSQLSKHFWIFEFKHFPILFVIFWLCQNSVSLSLWVCDSTRAFPLGPGTEKTPRHILCSSSNTGTTVVVNWEGEQWFQTCLFTARRQGRAQRRTGDRNVTWHGPGPAWHRFKDFTSPKVLGLLGLLGLLALLGLLDSGHLHDLIEFLLVPASQVWDLKQKKEVISFQADWGSNSADFGAPAQNSWKCQMSKEIKYLRDRTDNFELNLERKSKWIESLSLNLLGSWWFFSIPFLDRVAELCRRILQVAYAAQAWLGIPRCRKMRGKCRKQGWVMGSHGESLCDRLCEPPCESLRVSLDIT